MADATEAAAAEAAATGAISPTGARAVAILADDLIWATRLADAVRAAGATPRIVRRLADLETLVAGAAGAPGASDVIVDLTARAYDGVAAIRFASGTGARVVAVGQHDDVELRRAATEAGASRVFTYRALFEAGPKLLGKWLAG